MPVSRRDFVTTSSLAVAAGLLGQGRPFAQQPAAPTPPPVPVFAPIRRNIGTFTARGGTMGWLITPDAVLVVDSQVRRHVAAVPGGHEVAHDAPVRPGW